VEIPEEKALMTSFLKIFFSDGLKSVEDLLGDEGTFNKGWKICIHNDLFFYKAFAKEYAMSELTAGMSRTFKSFLGFVLKIFGQDRLKSSLECSNALSAGEYRAITY
jgi:hypothetical protein